MKNTFFLSILLFCVFQVNAQTSNRLPLAGELMPDQYLPKEKCMLYDYLNKTERPYTMVLTEAPKFGGQKSRVVTYTVQPDKTAWPEGTQTPKATSEVKLHYGATIGPARHCQSEDGVIGLSASLGTGPYTYVWQDGFEGPIREQLAPGAYTCVITDALGHKVVTTGLVVPTLDKQKCETVVEAKKKPSISGVSLSIAPNPATDFSVLNFEGLDLTDTDVQLTMFDIQGRVVKSWSQPATQRMTLELGGLVNGQYKLLVATSKGFKEEHTVVVAK